MKTQGSLILLKTRKWKKLQRKTPGEVREESPGKIIKPCIVEATNVSLSETQLFLSIWPFNDHNEGDIEVKLLDFEPHWKKRLIKETIAISRMKPDLNGNEGKFL